MTGCDVDYYPFFLSSGNFFKDAGQLGVMWPYFVPRINMFNEV